MPFFQSGSAIGVDFNNTSTTALFTLQDIKFGSGDSEWVYVKASGALLTGQMVTIAANGTAILATTTALMATTGLSGANNLGFCQGQFADQDYGWVARRGVGMAVMCSGTAAPSAQLYLVTNSNGGLSTTAGSGTLAGILLQASASTASLVITTAILTWPRCVAVTNNG